MVNNPRALLPTKKERGIKTYKEAHAEEFVGEHWFETNTDYINEHAHEFIPPFGAMHLHLIYARTVHWRVVTQASAVCKIPGRCHLVQITEAND